MNIAALTPALKMNKADSYSENNCIKKINLAWCSYVFQMCIGHLFNQDKDLESKTLPHTKFVLNFL